ncbi:MAG: methylenetetrahydrofolate--tRNA-(uracil(54)-C(5))-methyltransferase (FADH(2)-oxidizing) TrmFO [Negativicutes bacterium]
MKKPIVNIVGAGLAGSEAAWQAANRGCHVRLFEMRPVKMTAAHYTGNFAELVCSNSLKSDELGNACGLLKAEMRNFESIVIASADSNRVPAGGALAVDREVFSTEITKKLSNHDNIEIIRSEVIDLKKLLNDKTIIATGPLTSDALAKQISELCGAQFMYFYDAAAPIIEYDSIDMSIAYAASRYDRGEADYINLPMDKAQYDMFYNQLIASEKVALQEFEDKVLFEGCMPIEEMAARGYDTIRFGPLKPVGLINPHTGREEFAVVQLRQDNFAASLYNMVGFQTNLKWPEQKRVFRMIPGLANAEFIRYGVMHRNTFINSPKIISPTLNMQNNANIYFAGQITGVEGYVESAASGMLAGINAARVAHGQSQLLFPLETVLGSLCAYITTANKHFQPMNANFGIVPNAEKKIRSKKDRYAYYAERSLASLRIFMEKEHVCTNKTT